VGPGRVRPHLEEGRNAGTHPERKRIRGSGKTADFKPANFRGFQNVAERRSHDWRPSSAMEPASEDLSLSVDWLDGLEGGDELLHGRRQDLGLLVN
jgi:hypothetical protein